MNRNKSFAFFSSLLLGVGMIGCSGTPVNLGNGRDGVEPLSVQPDENATTASEAPADASPLVSALVPPSDAGELSASVVVPPATSAAPEPSVMVPMVPSLLVFSRTEEFRHDSIVYGLAALQQLALNNGWQIEATEDPTVFTDAGLAQANVIVFLNTTGDVLDDPQQAAMERFIQAGNGFVGIHGAGATEWDWAWYSGLLGTHFSTHTTILEAIVVVENTSHPSTSHLPSKWMRTDEWYALEVNPRPQVNVLLTLDETSNAAAGAMGDHPIAWYHEYDGGRSFVTAMGHTPESYADAAFIQHLAGGIQWASGAVDPDPGACDVNGMFVCPDGGMPSTPTFDVCAEALTACRQDAMSPDSKPVDCDAQYASCRELQAMPFMCDVAQVSCLQADPTDANGDCAEAYMRCAGGIDPTNPLAECGQKLDICRTGGGMNCVAQYVNCVGSDGLCGDAIVDANEQCDDGNQTDGDGCSVTCELDPATCELDGIVYPDGAEVPSSDCNAQYCVAGMIVTTMVACQDGGAAN